MPRLPRPMFAANPLDRMDALRAAVLDELAAADEPGGQARFALVAEGGVVLRRDGASALHPPHELPGALAGAAPDLAQAVFLGEDAGVRHFALRLAADPGQGYELADLRELARGGRLPEGELGVLAQASGVLNWHAAQRFCGWCGAETSPAKGGWRRDCPGCGRQHFPRIDPVVIMLVTHGGRTLLGRGRNFRVPGMYSCLAGFMEPGETVEDAARRELMEEAGVAALGVRYVCSQPWPFPAGLMLGLRAEAEGDSTRMDETELLDLRWATREDVRCALGGQGPDGLILPPRFSIAGVLLEGWAGEEGS